MPTYYNSNYKLRKGDAIVFDSTGFEDAVEKQTFPATFLGYETKPDHAYIKWHEEERGDQWGTVHLMYVRGKNVQTFAVTPVQVEDLPQSEEEMLEDLKNKYYQHQERNK